MSIRERHIKAALIDGLFQEGMIDGDAVVVSEMPVFGMARRADLVLANGRLIGFEIKSNADSIGRLRGQIAAFSTHFEGVAVICGSRHVEKVLATTDDAIGVFAVEEENGVLGVAKPVRKPRIRNMDADTAIRQMLAKDLLTLVKKAGIETSASDRSSLERYARDLEISVLRSGALKSIKGRYRQQFAAFTRAKEENVSTLDALPLLRRPPWNAHRPRPVEPQLVVGDDVDWQGPIFVRPRRA